MYTIISSYSMQFLVLSFIAICHIDIRPFLQHIVAALNWGPRSPNACLSFKHALMSEFYSSVICLIIENIDYLFPGWNLFWLFHVSQQQINGITLTMLFQPCPKSQFQPISTLFPLFSNEILKTSLKSTFPPAYTKAVNYTIRQDIRLVWRQLLQTFTLTDLPNLIIPWGRGRQWISWVCHDLFSDLKTPTSFFCTFLKIRYCFQPHALTEASPISEESLEVMACRSESSAAGTPSAPGEMPSASVDLNTSNYLK